MTPRVLLSTSPRAPALPSSPPPLSLSSALFFLAWVAAKVGMLHTPLGPEGSGMLGGGARGLWDAAHATDPSFRGSDSNEDRTTQGRLRRVDDGRAAGCGLRDH